MRGPPLVKRGRQVEPDQVLTAVAIGSSFRSLRVGQKKLDFENLNLGISIERTPGRRALLELSYGVTLKAALLTPHALPVEGSRTIATSVYPPTAGLSTLRLDQVVVTNPLTKASEFPVSVLLPGL